MLIRASLCTFGLESYDIRLTRDSFRVVLLNICFLLFASFEFWSVALRHSGALSGWKGRSRKVTIVHP